jgi:hypothetical protein
MSVILSPFAGAGAQFFTNSGNVLTGGKIYTYAAGTTTPQQTYTSFSGVTLHSNPIILDAAGRVPGGEIWLSEDISYKFVLKDSNDVLIGTYDNIDSLYVGTALANTTDPALGDALVGFRQSNASGNLTGAVGRTVHQKFQESVSVKDFGAVGDGTTDDSAAFQAAINFLASQNDASLYIPSGIYRLATRVSATFSAGSYSIFGDGASSIIVGDNSAGAIQMICTSRHVYTNVSNLSFSPALANSGTGFEYSASEGGVAQRNVFRMENCVFEPYDDADTTSSWFNVIVVTGTNRPSFNNIVAWRTGTDKPNAILNVDGCYKPIITDCYFNGIATYGISNIRSTDNEGFLIANTTINGADTGLYIAQSGRHPEIWVTHCHFNNVVAGVHLENSKYVWLCNNLMYSRALTGDSYSDYLLDDCDSVTIVENVYRQGTTQIPNRRHVNLINNTQLVKISDNGLNGRTAIAPFYVDSTCQQVDLYLPPYIPSYDLASYPSVLWEFDSTNNVFYHTVNEIATQNNNPGQSVLLRLYKNSDSPADGDSLANMGWYGNDSAGDKVAFVQIVAEAATVATGVHDGNLLFYTAQNGATDLQLNIGDGLAAGSAPRGRSTITAQGGAGSLFFGLGTLRGIYGGAGSPEGVVTANQGSLYLNQSGGANTTLYIKESGSSNTGWVAK